MAAFTAALATLIAAGGINSAVGQRRAASAAEAQGDYEAGVLGINAQLADRAADDSLQRGHEASGRARTTTRQLISAQRATLAAQGIALDDGSGALLQAESADLGELEVLRIANDAARESFGFRVEGANYRNQAVLARMGARNTAASLRNQSVSTLLTTGAQLGELAYRSKH